MATGTIPFDRVGKDNFRPPDMQQKLMNDYKRESSNCTGAAEPELPSPFRAHKVFYGT